MKEQLKDAIDALKADGFGVEVAMESQFGNLYNIWAPNCIAPSPCDLTEKQVVNYARRYIA